MTPLGPTTSVFTTRPVPLRFKVICCLWNVAEMFFVCFFFFLVHLEKNMKAKSVVISCRHLFIFTICCRRLRCRLLGCLRWILGDTCSFSLIKSPSVSFSFAPLILPSVHSFCFTIDIMFFSAWAGWRWNTLRLPFPCWNHHPVGFGLSDLWPELLSCSPCRFLVFNVTICRPPLSSSCLFVRSDHCQVGFSCSPDRRLRLGQAGEVGLLCLDPAASLSSRATVLTWQDLGRSCWSARAMSS